jgi:hypothetical protein
MPLVFYSVFINCSADFTWKFQGYSVYPKLKAENNVPHTEESLRVLILSQALMQETSVCTVTTYNSSAFAVTNFFLSSTRNKQKLYHLSSSFFFGLLYERIWCQWNPLPWTVNAREQETETIPSRIQSETLPSCRQGTITMPEQILSQRMKKLLPELCPIRPGASITSPTWLQPTNCLPTRRGQVSGTSIQSSLAQTQAVQRKTLRERSSAVCFITTALRTSHTRQLNTNQRALPSHSNVKDENQRKWGG